ncbi:MAG: serine/threonine protein kinase, partial [Planctomycetales bacterium]
MIHPHVVQIHFIGEDDGHHFFAMQFVQALPLSQHIRRCGKLSVGETLLISEQVLEGLAAAHELDLVHLDIKPGNILLDQTSSRALLADFGLVKSLEGSHSMATSRGTVLGTAEYLSPEQGLGKEVDGRSDLYSVGVMMFQMLTGQVPFRGNSMTAMIYQHVHERPPKLAKVAPELPRALTAIVERLLKKHPDERFQTAHEVLDALRELPDERCWSCGAGSDAPQPVSVRRSTAAGRSPRSVIARTPSTGRKVLIGAGLVVVLGAIVLGVWRPWTDSKSGSTDDLTGDPSTQGDSSKEKDGPTTTARDPEEAETAPTEWTGPKGIRRLAGHTQSMVALAVSLDGTRLLSRDVTGKLRVWNAGTDELVAKIDGGEFGVALRRA